MTLYQVRYSGTLATAEAYNFSLWFTSANSLSQMLTDATTWINTAWGASSSLGIQSSLNTTVTMNKIHVGTINQATGVQTTATQASSILAGGISTGTSVPCPPETAIVVSLRTALTGRSYRGRFFLPQPHVGMLTTVGEWDATKLGVVRNGIQSAYAAIAGTATPCLYRRTAHAIENITAFDMTNIPACIGRRVNKTVATRITGTI